MKEGGADKTILEFSASFRDLKHVLGHGYRESLDRNDRSARDLCDNISDDHSHMQFPT